MKFLSVAFLLSVAAFAGTASAQKGAQFPVTYSGGTLPFQHHKVYATLDKDEVIFMQHGRRVAVSAKSITEISYGAERHHAMPFVEVEDHYIGVSWAGTDAGSHAQVLLKLSRGESREFIAALEQLTGIKAIDTNQVPTVVRYRG